MVSIRVTTFLEIWPTVWNTAVRHFSPTPQLWQKSSCLAANATIVSQWMTIKHCSDADGLLRCDVPGKWWTTVMPRALTEYSVSPFIHSKPFSRQGARLRQAEETVSAALDVDLV